VVRDGAADVDRVGAAATGSPAVNLTLTGNFLARSPRKIPKSRVLKFSLPDLATFARDLLIFSLLSPIFPLAFTATHPPSTKSLNA
jgi:hypothetical protein